MAEASHFDVKITTGSQSNKGIFNRVLTLELVIGWINNQGLDEYTTKGLIEMVSRYPTAALPAFKRNFNLMLQRVRAKRKQEDAVNQVEEIKEL